MVHFWAKNQPVLWVFANSMIDAQKLKLRNPRQDDREFLTKLFSDEDVIHYLVGSTQRASTRIDDLCAPLAITREDKEYWIAERTEDGSQVGYASAFRCNTPRVEITFAVSPDFRHCGYGYELVASLIGILTTKPHIQTILAVINHNNSYSKRIVEKLGFIETIVNHYEKSLRPQTEA
jgi:RimJ/RimL family protein N-acetyltransferase